ncbi:MAG TPA: agmatinase [Desulfatiglandales bacterium]|nr:agmatinase [Desulfatiglandales bacterium]
MPGQILSFCGSSYSSDYTRASIVILPVPFDKTSTWMKGADKGPQKIIEASQYLELYDIETDSEVLKKGIFTSNAIHAATSAAMIKKTCSAVSDYLRENKFVVVLGGEHSVSIGAIKSFAGYYEDLSILHLDAHTDRRDTYKGSRYNHACVIARAREYVGNIVSVGIRSMDASERRNVDSKRIFFAHSIHDSETWIEKAVSMLTDRVYVTIDLDVFDPSIMPSTGTPEPGGLGWYQVLRLLRSAAESKRIVGFDVVELCPSDSWDPDFLAAKLVYILLSYIYAFKPVCLKSHRGKVTK